LSSNLVKQMYMVVPEESKRVIDSNERMRRRLDLIRDTLPDMTPEGFVSGLAAETVELLPEEEMGEGNVIKAGSDLTAFEETARLEAELLVRNARAEASGILSEARAQAEQESIAIIEAARKKGYDEGMRKAQEKEQALEKEYNHRIQEMESFYAQQVEVLEPRFVDTITSIYEHIFNVDLGAYREVLLHLISETIHTSDGSRNFLVHVSKEDYAFVSEKKEQLLANLGESWKVDVIEDSILGAGQCMIETENGIFDCGLGTQMEELKKKLMLLAWSKED